MGEAGKRPERGSEGETCERGGPSMDTPERDRVTAPIFHFEDSPVFNYIVNLSPINIVKPMRLSQTLNPLNLASPPPIFTSPHASSLRGCTLLRRYTFSDPSIPEHSSENKAGSTEVVEVTHNSNQQYDTSGPARFMAEDTVKPSDGSSSPAIDVSCFLNDNGGSPICSATPCNGHESVSLTRLAGTSVSAVSQVSGRDSKGSGVHLERLKNIVQNNETARCDWESLITDTSDLLIFASPNDAEAFSWPSLKPHDYDGRYCSSYALELKPDEQNDLHEKQDVIQFEQHKPTSGQAAEECYVALKDSSEELVVGTSLNVSVAEVPSKQINNELASRLHRGMKRRCLVFETAGSRIKHLDDCASSGSSRIAQPDSKIEHSDKHPVLMKPRNVSSRHTLPGIGLHLNALSRNSEEINITHDTLATAKLLTEKPSHPASLQTLTANQGPLKKCTTVPSLEKNWALAESGVKKTENASLVTGYIVSDCNQSSPMKRHKLENAGASEGCKRCNCKKSKCLKLYCDCFAAGLYCVEPCSCQDCFNKPLHEDTVLATRKQIESRNPLAFAPKVIRSSDSVQEIGDDSSKTPASARHKRGCNCKKSGCLKKYCECYQSGVGCSINCRCEGCKNAFGRKDGSASMGAETEVETEEHKDPYDKCGTDRNLKYSVPNSDQQNLDSRFSASPLRANRMSAQMPFSELRNPLQPSFLSVGSSSAYHGGQRFGKENKGQPLEKVEKQTQTIDGIPRILQGNCSPINGIKSASPNRKRVSPPHLDCGSSSPPCQRSSSRKLILQSIPSFPSLTPKH